MYATPRVLNRIASLCAVCFAVVELVVGLFFPCALTRKPSTPEAAPAKETRPANTKTPTRESLRFMKYFPVRSTFGPAPRNAIDSLGSPPHRQRFLYACEFD